MTRIFYAILLCQTGKRQMGYLQNRNVFCDYASDLDPILIETDNELPWGHGCHRQVFPQGGNSLSYTF